MTINVNNEMITFSADTGIPYIDEHNRMQVPLRQTLETCNVAVDFKESYVICHKDGITIEIPMGQKYLIKNGEKITIDTNMQIIKGRTYLPIRPVLEALGFKVIYQKGYLDIYTEELVSVKVFGEQVTFPYKQGIPFYDEQGKLQVPVQTILDALEFEKVTVQDNSVVGLKGSDLIELYVGSNIRVNQSSRNNCMVKSKDGIIYVPLEELIYQIGYEVTKNNNQFEITNEGIKNKEILKYNIPSGLGSAHLTIDEIKTLVGKDLDIVKEKITTVADLLQYMISSEFKWDSRGDLKFRSQGLLWATDYTASTALKENMGNCGSIANLVKAILGDDYDEVGYIYYSGDTAQGGHAFNYIKQDGIYYVIDFTKYNPGSYTNYHNTVYEAESLESYSEVCKEQYESDELDIKVIVAYNADELLPVGFRLEDDEKIGRFFDKDAKISVLYEETQKKVEFVTGPNKAEYPKTYMQE